VELYHKNPRQITEKQFNDLDEWLSELGDLSGIVHDLNSDEVIGGNQRSRVFDINKCEIVLTEELEEPDDQGTVAHGYVIWKGKKYAYRQVRWDDKQCEKANIVSNKGGGSMDFDILANEFDVDDLLDWGFQSYELGIAGDDIDYDKEWEGMPEFEQEDVTPIKELRVKFLTKDAFIDFAALINQSISIESGRSIWYPQKDWEQTSTKKKWMEE